MYLFEKETQIEVIKVKQIQEWSKLVFKKFQGMKQSPLKVT